MLRELAKDEVIYVAGGEGGTEAGQPGSQAEFFGNSMNAVLSMTVGTVQAIATANGFSLSSGFSSAAASSGTTGWGVFTSIIDFVFSGKPLNQGEDVALAQMHDRMLSEVGMGIGLSLGEMQILEQNANNAINNGGPM